MGFGGQALLPVGMMGYNTLEERVTRLETIWSHRRRDRRRASLHRRLAFKSSSLSPIKFHKKERPHFRVVFLFYGAGDEARTRYLHLGKVALYRMSYTRNGLDHYNKEHYTLYMILRMKARGQPTVGLPNGWI